MSIIILDNAINSRFKYLKSVGLDDENAKLTILSEINEIVININKKSIITKPKIFYNIKLYKYTEFGSCSKCSQCNMTSNPDCNVICI